MSNIRICILQNLLRDFWNLQFFGWDFLDLIIPLMLISPPHLFFNPEQNLFCNTNFLGCFASIECHANNLSLTNIIQDIKIVRSAFCT